jgi:hypothetical protein
MLLSKACKLSKQKSYCFFVFLCVCLNLFSQDVLTRGKIKDSISVLNTDNETFALYLPSTFKKDVQSPIVFIFEPAARGKVGLTPFIEASEKFGYILVCSNNSKNGPYSRNFAIANNLFSLIFKKFIIDRNSMYLAGFSGGSRLVSAIGVLTNTFAGVIACGAGFSNHLSHLPSAQKFSYVGLCGNEDMNYKEMLGNYNFLQKKGFRNTLITYNGKHNWPPKEQINRAYRWLENIKGNDSIAVIENLKIDLNETERFIGSGELLLAAENYTRILKSYPSFSEEDVKDAYEDLIMSKEYKDQYKSHQRALEEEDKIATKLFNRLLEDYLLPQKADLNWWKKELEKLERRESNGSMQQQKMIARVRFSVFATVYSRKNKNLYKSNPEQIAISNKIQKLIYTK